MISWALAAWLIWERVRVTTAASTHLAALLPKGLKNKVRWIMTISLHRSPLSQPTALLRRKYHLIYAPVAYTRSVCSCILFDYFWSTFRGGCNGIRRSEEHTSELQS